MRAVIIGGTFNPIHIGHLWLAREVREKLGYEKVFFVPTHKPVHKQIADGVSDEDRLHMLRLALEDFPAGDIETCELYREGLSYSIDTVRWLKKVYTFEEKPGLVLGDDLFSSFNTWKDAKSLAEEAKLIIAHRLYRENLPSSYPHIYLDNIILDISSSYLRGRLKKFLPVEPFIPPKVLSYISLKGLYI